MESKTDFPDRCFSGIKNEDYVDEDGFVDERVFVFETNPRRRGYREASIFWEDDTKTVQFVLSRINHKYGTPRYKGGIAVIPTEKLEGMKKLPPFKNFDFERDSWICNRYHGNLFFRPPVKDKIIKRARIHLSDYVSAVIKR